MRSKEVYESFSVVLSYPDGEIFRGTEHLGELLRRYYPKQADAYEPFLLTVRKLSMESLQELYVRSFDLQAASTLDIGYILFGEDYNRGKLLVHLNQEHQKAGVDCGKELSDHLPNVLRLMVRLEDGTFMEELVRELVYPAIRKMVSDFDPARLGQRDLLYKKHYKTLLDVPIERRYLYGDVLAALHQVLTANFSGRLNIQPLLKASADFLTSVREEIRMEG